VGEHCPDEKLHLFYLSVLYVFQQLPTSDSLVRHSTVGHDGFIRT
jgi:hypothetical protein